MQRVRPSGDLKQLTLLYVEDEESIREPFLMLIERYFKKVYVGKNGKEGLELFKEHKDEIDIIISDIRMPMMDGLEMARQIREIKYVPILFATAFGDNEYLQKAIEVGAEGYIVKPIDRNKLFEKLNQLAKTILSKKETEQYMNLIKILFDYQQNGLLLLDEEFNVILYNRAFGNMLDYAKIKPSNVDELIENCIDLDNNTKFNKEFFLSKINDEVDCKSEKTGKYFHVDIKKVNKYYLLNISDVTEYHLKAEEIKDKAMQDELTGLYNRKKIDLLADEFISNDLCMILFDIDNFKNINDTYGHLKGDEVLKKLASKIKYSVRGSDIVVRWGGEEFLVLLQNQKDIQIAQKLAEKLRVAVSEIYIDEVGHFSCSFGVACGHISSKEDINTLLNKADEALYKAKRNGKNRVEIS